MDKMTGTIMTAAIVLLAAIFGGLYYNKEGLQTRNQLDSLLLQAQQNDFKELQVRDAWGHDVIYERIESESAVFFSLTSSGRDGRFHTKDDIVRTATKINVLRKMGKVWGEAKREFAAGVKESQ